MAIRIALADHHVLVRTGLRLILERERLTVVAEASDDREAVVVAAKTRPNIALVDVALPQLGGLDAARRLRHACPDIRVILLGTIDERHVFEAFRSSVCGFLLKTQPPEDMLEAIRNVYQGGIYVGPQSGRALLRTLRSNTRPDESLSPRERQLLYLVADGKTTKQAGAVLGITFKTAEYYRTRLMRKLNVHSTAGLVRYAIQANVTAHTG